MAYNYTIAKDVLNENDKNRLLCLYLNCETTAVNQLIDWEKAAKDFGCASVDSMKVMTRSVLKKVADAGGKEGVEAKAKAASKKRKVKGDGEGESKPKKRGRKGKKVDSPVEDEEVEKGEEGVKKEPGAEEEDEL